MVEIKIGDAKYWNKYVKPEDLHLNLNLVFFRNSFIATQDEDIIFNMIRAGLKCCIFRINAIEHNYKDNNIILTLKEGTVGWKPCIKPFGQIIEFIPYKNEQIEGEIYL